MNNCNTYIVSYECVFVKYQTKVPNESTKAKYQSEVPRASTKGKYQEDYLGSHPSISASILLMGVSIITTRAGAGARALSLVFISALIACLIGWASVYGFRLGVSAASLSSGITLNPLCCLVVAFI